MGGTEHNQRGFETLSAKCVGPTHDIPIWLTFSIKRSLHPEGKDVPSVWGRRGYGCEVLMKAVRNMGAALSRLCDCFFWKCRPFAAP